MSFLGAYPEGMLEAALAELKSAQAEIERIDEAHLFILFRLQHPRWLGCFLVVFELIGDVQPVPESAIGEQVDLKALVKTSIQLLCTEPLTVKQLGSKLAHLGFSWRKHKLEDILLDDGAIILEDNVLVVHDLDVDQVELEVVDDSMQHVLKRHIGNYRARWQAGICGRWRATCMRNGTHSFRSIQAETWLADALEMSPEDQTTQVDLDNCEVEALMWVHDDKYAVGIRKLTEPQVCKGRALSRATTTIASCVAQMVCAQSIVPRRILDPMCGVGTFLCAFSWIAQNENRSFDLFGNDLEAESIATATQNLKTHMTQDCTFQGWNGSSTALDFIEDESMDAVVVDPPWGHRHGTHSQIRRDMPYWVLEWLRVLKTGHRLWIVTIRSRHMEQEVIPRVHRKQAVKLERSWTFDNNGHKQCKCFVLQKL